MIEKKNYYGIDLLKFIMAVCVVAIHTQPLYSVQSIVVQRLFDTITSLAVPYFFSVSGFLLFSKIDADISCRKNMEVCKRYLSRVLSLYVIWNIIYLPITIFGFKVIIPGLSEPPVRTLRATIPENESHIFR